VKRVRGENHRGSERHTMMDIPRRSTINRGQTVDLLPEVLIPFTHQSRIKIFLIAVFCKIAFAATATLLKKQKPMDLFGSAW